jgi:hypothetical protein
MVKNSFKREVLAEISFVLIVSIKNFEIKSFYLKNLLLKAYKKIKAQISNHQNIQRFFLKFFEKFYLTKRLQIAGKN